MVSPESRVIKDRRNSRLDQPHAKVASMRRRALIHRQIEALYDALLESADALIANPCDEE